MLAAGTAVGTVAVGTLFTLVPSLSWNPWPDACIFAGTLAAMYAQARGLVEFWLAWLAGRHRRRPAAFASGLPFSGLVYVVYRGFVLWGLRAWWLQPRAPRRPHVPAPGRSSRMTDLQNPNAAPRITACSTPSSGPSPTSPPAGPSSSSTTRTARTRAT